MLLDTEIIDLYNIGTSDDFNNRLQWSYMPPPTISYEMIVDDYGLSFDGSTNFVTFEPMVLPQIGKWNSQSNSITTLTMKFSIAMWVKFGDNNEYTPTTCFSVSNPSVGYIIIGQIDKKLCLAIENSVGDAKDISGGNVVIGKWTFVVCTLEEMKMKIYQDGELVSFTDNGIELNYGTYVYNFIGRSHNHLFGYTDGNPVFFHGAIKSMYLWKRAIDLDEVLLLYNFGIPLVTKEPSTINYTVTVQNVNGSNKYFIDGQQQYTLSLVVGNTYIFDWSSAISHPFKFSTIPDDVDNNGEYTTGVTIDRTNYTTTILLEGLVPTNIYYHCELHSGMGGQVNILTISSDSFDSSDNFYDSSGGLYNIEFDDLIVDADLYTPVPG